MDENIEDIIHEILTQREPVRIVNFCESLM